MRNIKFTAFSKFLKSFFCTFILFLLMTGVSFADCLFNPPVPESSSVTSSAFMGNEEGSRILILANVSDSTLRKSFEDSWKNTIIRKSPKSAVFTVSETFPSSGFTSEQIDSIISADSIDALILVNVTSDRMAGFTAYKENKSSWKKSSYCRVYSEYVNRQKYSFRNNMTNIEFYVFDILKNIISYSNDKSVANAKTESDKYNSINAFFKENADNLYYFDGSDTSDNDTGNKQTAAEETPAWLFVSVLFAIELIVLIAFVQ